MKNKLSDLNDHLFMQLERLNDESMNEDNLKIEIERSKYISMIATKIVDNGRLVLDAQTRIHDMPEQKPVPKMLT